jgi:hypothetical protein
VTAPVPPPDWVTTVAPVADSPNGEVVWLDTKTARPTRFVERPLLQERTFHVLAGQPSIGKGLLCARWVAHCTNGLMFGRPRRAVILSTEDDAELDLVPRIEAAEGDTSRVALVPKSFLLPRDMDWLESFLLRIDDVGLVIIDPLANHIGGTNSNADEEVRAAIIPLNDLASKMDGAIVGIRHASTKDARGSSFVSRVLGSTAWIAVPRVVIGAGRDGETLHVRTIKGNRVPHDEAGVRFAIVSQPREPADDWPQGVGRAVDDGVSTVDLDTLGAKSEEGGKAKRAQAEIVRVLRENNGRMLSDALDTQVALMVGCSARTVRNQRMEMKNWGWLAAFPERSTDGKVEQWFVALTNSAPYDSDVEEAVADPLAHARARVESISKDSGYLQGDLTQSPNVHAPENQVPSPESLPGILDEVLGPQIETAPAPPPSAPVPAPISPENGRVICPVCSGTVGAISGRCHSCGEKVNPMDVG